MKTILVILLLGFFHNTDNPSDENKIFIQSQSPFNGQLLILEEDDYSVYVYIIQEDKKGIDFDGFLCSVSDPFTNDLDLNKIRESGAPPPLIEKYANEFSYVTNLKEKDIKINWTEKSVEIFIKGEKYLAMDLIKKLSYSKSLNMDGPYGKALAD